ncbi:O(6)-methylguanine-induced apoptosis 2-like [Saccoglossus kowalevskii]|uniref:O(6)-methylguanine-induced apoptosis 2-like n=1 Tax=Saccoglossus kowalevskii TaxID=10224 RepID=A0ABM0GYC2_SACKO|nr:PREDICTED: O(6)-methylguanine-induced apoptosis 2-like [Saccoglossus kowalevskii]
MADSVQTFDTDYQRIPSRPSGRIHKGHGMTAASSSIPSRYQTIVIDNSEKKGFNARTKRFQYETNASENPGPGSYVSLKDPDFTTSSLSKKGMGVGFVSKAPRIQKRRGTAGPGPAQYGLPSVLKSKSDFNRSTSTSSFAVPIATNVKDKLSKQPAPNSYNVSKRAVEKHYGSQVQASFKSTSRRPGLNVVKDHFPSPSQYNVSDELTKDSVKIPFSSFKSTSRRMMTGTPPLNPGPGHYKPFEPSTDPVKRQILPRKHYLCISAPAMPLPPPLPEPGPGSYDTVDYVGPSKHYMSSSVFVSNTSRWTGDVTNADIPGPATYRPENLGNKQSFFYNAQNRWI